MASKTYVTKGYSPYTSIPGNEYMVGTNTIEKVHAPVASFKAFDGSPSEDELMEEYVHSPTMLTCPKFAPINHFDRHGLNYEKVSPTKHQRPNIIYEAHNANLFASPAHDYPSGPKTLWLSAVPPATHHPLTNPTNNIHEASGLLEEYVYYSRADPRQRGVLDELSTRAQPLEPHSRYARPVSNDVTLIIRKHY